MFDINSPVFSEFITTLITAVIVYLTVYLQKWIQDNRRGKQYKLAYDMAYGIWIDLEEQLPALIGEDKMAKMKAILHKLFPMLSDEQLTAINKEIHNRAKAIYEMKVEDDDDGTNTI